MGKRLGSPCGRSGCEKRFQLVEAFEALVRVVNLLLERQCGRIDIVGEPDKRLTLQAQRSRDAAERLGRALCSFRRLVAVIRWLGLYSERCRGKGMERADS